jgi:hypothetical protein
MLAGQIPMVTGFWIRGTSQRRSDANFLTESAISVAAPL